MRKLVILTFLSLDGVMQAPGAKDEDLSGGFAYGGWLVPYFDDTLGDEMAKQMGQPYDLLLGKTTYDIFAAYWPKHTGNDSGINAATKYVVSDEPVATDWKKTIPITNNVVDEIKKLKQQVGPMLQVHGSSVLIQTLLEHDLADELWLKIFPITLGSGKRLFQEGTRPAAFKLTSSNVSPSGVIIASYKRDGEIKVGEFE